MTGYWFTRPRNVAQTILSGRHAASVCLAMLPDGPVLVLKGPARVIWEELLAGSGPDEESPSKRVARRYGLPTADVEGDVQEMVNYLLERGFLERSRSAPSP